MESFQQTQDLLREVLRHLQPREAAAAACVHPAWREAVGALLQAQQLQPRVLIACARLCQTVNISPLVLRHLHACARWQAARRPPWWWAGHQAQQHHVDAWEPRQLARTPAPPPSGGVRSRSKMRSAEPAWATSVAMSPHGKHELHVCVFGGDVQ